MQTMNKYFKYSALLFALLLVMSAVLLAKGGGGGGNSSVPNGSNTGTGVPAKDGTGR
jgi:hypothetical protein